MNLDDIPKLRNNFYREESNGKTLIIPEGLDQNFSVLLNKDSFYILQLCDSKRSIREIMNILNLKSNEFDELNLFFKNLIKKQIIEKFVEDTMYNGINFNIKEDYEVHRCGEGDLELILSIMNDFNLKDKENNSYYNEQKIVITNTNEKILTKNKLRRLHLRNNLFKFAEEFYILKRNNENLGIISFTNESNKYAKIYELNYINFSNKVDMKILNNFLLESVNNLKNEICYNCEKIKFATSSNVKKEVLDLIKSTEFIKVGILRNEFGKGNDKILFEKYL